MSRYCPSCHACILDFGNYTDQRHCDVILAPSANLGPPSSRPIRTGTPVSQLLLALPLARELFAVQPPDCRYLRLAFPCEGGGCFWTYPLWRMVIATVLRRGENSYEDLTQRIDTLRKRILDFQIEAAASLDIEGLIRKRADIVKEGNSIVGCLGEGAPILEWGEFPSSGASSFAQDIACLSSIRRSVERSRATLASPEPVESENVIGVMAVATALKRLGAAKLARDIELRESSIVQEQPLPSVDGALEQFEEDVKSLRRFDQVDRQCHVFMDGVGSDVHRKPENDHPESEVISEPSVEDDVSEDPTECQPCEGESERNEDVGVAVESPVVQSRVERMKEDMVKRIAEQIVKAQAARQNKDQDDNVLSEYLQSTPVGRASCYGTGESTEGERGKPPSEVIHCESSSQSQLDIGGGGVLTDWLGNDSSTGGEMLDTEDLMDYLPPLADSALPMNLTIKTTASEELDKLADLRGRLALEARREEKRKEEEARRLAVGRREMIKVAASEERETVRRKAVQGRAEENPNLPSPVRRAKQRLAKSLKMEAERRQREEEEKSKTQAEIFRKRDERINRYLARQREKLKRVPERKPERRTPVASRRSAPPDYSLTPPKTLPSYKASRPWIANEAIGAASPVDGRVFLSEAQARDFNRAVVDPISPVEEVPRSPRLPDSLASSESVDIEDESELIDDLLIGI